MSEGGPINCLSRAEAVDSELRRFVHEHLTAAALMVELAPPLASNERTLEARRYLESNDFDVALIEDERLFIVTRSRLREIKSRSELAEPIAQFAGSPRRDRLIERTLPIRDVVAKLLADHEPLLVVGAAGATHIITRADFAGVTGTSVVLAYLVTLDRSFNELLRAYGDAAIKALSQEQRDEAQQRRNRAEAEGAALDLIDYVSMGSRLIVLRKLGLDQQLGLGTREQHELLRRTRNDAAHGTVSDPDAALRAIELAEEFMERLTALAPQPVPGAEDQRR